MRLDHWFLTAAERGNPATHLDEGRGDGVAWSTGNQVRPLIHGASYFAELLSRVNALEAGDLLLFTDWRGDSGEPLAAAAPRVAGLFGAAAQRGAVVKGLVWRSHLDRFRFSSRENRHMGEEIDAAGGQCLLDMRVRPGGSHHMKLAVLRHAARPERDVAFVGGIVQLMISGPAVADVETVFRERWDDPAPPTRNPVARLRDRLAHVDEDARRLPPQRPGPPRCGQHAVQLLRTYPYRRDGYPFAPEGERSIARSYLKVLPRARSLVYLEDQYLWSTTVAGVLAKALAESPALHLIAVLPGFPDQDGRLSAPPNLVSRAAALRMIRRAGGDRVGIYYLENEAGTPIYVHAKVCVVDDTWAIVGSDNFNRRSWTHDSELSCAVIDEGAADGGDCFPRALRAALSREHLGATDDADTDLGPAAVKAFRRAAADLDAWHEGGQRGPRPPGQLRRYPRLQLSTWTRAWASAAYRLIYDPDGRPRDMRRTDSF